MNNFSTEPLAQLKLIFPELTDEDFDNIQLQEDETGEITIALWDVPFPRPTEQQLENTKFEADTKAQSDATLAATRTALKATWDSQPSWIRGPYRYLLDGAVSLLDELDFAAAVDLIGEAELSKASTQDNTNYPDLGGLTKEEYFNALKSQFKAAIESLAISS